MRFVCFCAVLGITSLASIGNMPEPAQAEGRLHTCVPNSYMPSMYYPQPYTHAPGYPPAQPTKFVTVGVYDNYFVPKTLNVQPGMTVRWVNYGRACASVSAPKWRRNNSSASAVTRSWPYDGSCPVLTAAIAVSTSACTPA